MKILISACLLGHPCRYDGKSKPCEAVLRLAQKHELLPVCPEELGGLPTPRIPSERQKDGRVQNQKGEDVTAAYRKGAEAALEIARTNGVELALLKAKSPSCGCGRIYDGSFSRTLTEGNGVTAELLLSHGIRVHTEEEFDRLPL